MKIISWNIRGLSSPTKHMIIKKRITKEHPTILYMQETKCSNSTLEKISKKIWKGCRKIAVYANGASGGLEIIWNPLIITLEKYHANRHFIQANFHLIGTVIHGLLTNVYFPQNIHQKTELLYNIAELNNQRSLPL